MIKLVVFDWNGVLIADSRACFEADNNVLRNFGGKIIDFKTWKNTIVIPAIDFYCLHGANRTELLSNRAKWSKSFHDFYESRVQNIRSRKWAKNILEWLNKSSIKCIILSNHTTQGIEYHLKRLGIGKYFFKVLANSSDDTSLKNRNKLEKLKLFLSENGFKNAQTLIVGDSPEESEIGKNLGIRAVAIENGYYSKERLKKSKPDYTISNLKELKDIVNQ